MHPGGAIAFLVCGCVVILLAGVLPFLWVGLRPNERGRLPWGAVILAAVFVLRGTSHLRLLDAGDSRVNVALLLTAAMIVGIFVKWIVEVVTVRPFALHETALIYSLLLAGATVVLFGPAVFSARLTAPMLLLWFANGFFWQTVCADVVRLRTRERAIVRRREPPLPT
jgi:hypothetical protein